MDHDPSPSMALHPQFEACIEHVDDPFWKKVFQDAARGKFHKNVYHNIKENTLTFISPTERIHLVMDNQPIENLTQKMISLHQTCLGYYSPQDLQHRADTIQTIKNNYQQQNYTSWKDVKKHTIKGSLVTDYVGRYPSDVLLTQTQIQQCVRDILFYMDMGVILPDRVHMEEDVIARIDGIEIQQGQLTFTEKPKKATKKKTKSMTSTRTGAVHESWMDDTVKESITGSLLKQWEKYLSDL